MAGNDINEIKEFINCVYMNKCRKISGRGMLTYAVGECDGDYYICIYDNVKDGSFSRGWICGKKIDAAVLNQTELTGENFYALQDGKSNNTGGFIMAALRDLGFVRKRVRPFYEHVPLTTFKSVVERRLEK